MDHLTVWKFTKSWSAVLGTPGFDDYTARHFLRFLPSFETQEQAVYWAERHPDALDRAEKLAVLSQEIGGLGSGAHRCVHYHPGVVADCDECSEDAIKRGWAGPAVAAAAACNPNVEIRGPWGTASRDAMDS